MTVKSVAEAVSHRTAWKGINSVERVLRLGQFGLPILVLLGANSHLAQGVSYCARARKVIGLMRFARDIGWIVRGHYFKSTLTITKKDGTQGEVHDYHFGSYGKQAFLLPCHFIATITVGQMAGLYSLGRASPLLKQISLHCWLSAMACETGDQWARWSENDPNAKPVNHPYGRLGIMSELTLAFCCVAFKGLVPDTLTNAVGVWTGAYWLYGIWAHPLIT